MVQPRSASISKTLLCALFCLALVAGFALPRSAAACCGGQGTVCQDGYKTGQFECCGKGPCNIFCCNCDGGCREPKAEGCVPRCDSIMKVCRSGCDLCIGEGCFQELCFEACTREGRQCKERCGKSVQAAAAPQSADVSVWSRFDALDGDKNGLLTRQEIEQGFDKVRLCVSKEGLPKAFAAADGNKDGSLSPEEAGFPPRPKAD